MISPMLVRDAGVVVNGADQACGLHVRAVPRRIAGDPGAGVAGWRTNKAKRPTPKGGLRAQQRRVIGADLSALWETTG
jgi:hypothetical protein